MKKPWFVTCLTVIVLLSAVSLRGAVKPETLKAWDHYVELTVQRIQFELKQPEECIFLRCDLAPVKDVTGGKIITKQVPATRDSGGAAIDVKDGSIHHWFGAVFIPNVKLDQVLAWVRNYKDYPKHFEEVEKAGASQSGPNTYDVDLRLTRTKYKVTVHYNTRHHVVYGPTNAANPVRSSSSSESTKIAQIEDAGKTSERELLEGEDSGYLWKLNAYWRFTEKNGGVIVENESIALSRSLKSWEKVMGTLAHVVTFGGIPSAEGIAEEVAKDSLKNTLTSVRDGVRGSKSTDKNAGKPK